MQGYWEMYSARRPSDCRRNPYIIDLFRVLFIKRHKTALPDVPILDLSLIKSSFLLELHVCLYAFLRADLEYPRSRSLALSWLDWVLINLIFEQILPSLKYWLNGRDHFNGSGYERFSRPLWQPLELSLVKFSCNRVKGPSNMMNISSMYLCHERSWHTYIAKPLLKKKVRLPPSWYRLEYDGAQQVSIVTPCTWRISDPSNVKGIES